MLNLSIVLEQSAKNIPNHEAFVYADMRLTFAQTNAAANQVANGLKSIGIKKGDKVALSCLNLPYFPIIYYGILKLGGVVVPLSVLLKRDEIAYHLQNSDAKAYLCFQGTPDLPMGEEGHAGFLASPDCQHFFVITGNPKAESPIVGTATLGSLMAQQSPHFNTVATKADDDAVIIYTSGTTGKPKGAQLSHINLFINVSTSADTFLQLRDTDVQLLTLPMFHIFAMTVNMNAGVYKGVKSILLPRFDAQAALNLMQKEKVTFFAGVPTMYWALLNCPNTEGADLAEISKNLRLCVSGGASLPVQVLTEFDAKFKVAILEGYGMSEGSPVVTFNQPNKERKPGSIGTPVWGVDVMLIDEKGKQVPTGEKGELIYRGPNVMKGYYKSPVETRKALKNGWLHSGDVAVQDNDGYFYIVDRVKDMIIRGGLNVYPREVEEVMMKHEAISLVAVIGVPSDEHGEEVKAYVVLKPDVVASPEEIVEWTKSKIAAYKYPRTVQIMAALPMTATGKILKKDLRKLV